MNSSGDSAREHLRTDANIRLTTRIYLEKRLIPLPACRFENIAGFARVRAAWALFEENSVSRRIPAVDRDHAINKRRNTTLAGCLFVRCSAQYGQHIIEVPPPHSLDQGELVWKILIEGPDADACYLGNSIGRETGPPTFSQNVSGSV